MCVCMYVTQPIHHHLPVHRAAVHQGIQGFGSAERWNWHCLYYVYNKTTTPPTSQPRPRPPADNPHNIPRVTSQDDPTKLLYGALRCVASFGEASGRPPTPWPPSHDRLAGIQHGTTVQGCVGGRTASKVAPHASIVRLLIPT